MAQVLHVPAPFPGQGQVGGLGEGPALEGLNGEDTLTVTVREGKTALM